MPGFRLTRSFPPDGADYPSNQNCFARYLNCLAEARWKDPLEIKPHRWHLKTESCSFNYGAFHFITPLRFLPHSSADPVTNQLWLARSCNVASSISPPNFSHLPGCCWTISMQLKTNSQYMSHMISALLLSNRWSQPQSLVACFGWRAR